MSRETVYNAAKLPSSKRDDIAAAILAGLLGAYQAAIRLQLRGYNYGDREVVVTDPSVLARLQARADQQALTVITFTNTLLAKFLDTLGADLTDEQMVAELTPFWDRAATYNQAVLTPLLTRWAASQATLDFIARTLGTEPEWECTPDYTDSSDEECDCPAAIAASPMSYDEAMSFDMPNHPNCFHSMTPVIAGDTVWPDVPWTGGVDDSPATEAA